jgi:hypothetical protein
MGCELTVKANTGGRSYWLNEMKGWTLTAYDGLGIANIRRLAQRGPFQDGDTDLGFRRDPRFISLTWIHQGCNPADLYDIRATLHGIFRPRVDDDTQLIFELPNAKRYAADVNLQGLSDYLTSNRLDGDTWQVSLVLKASDPRLYDPSEFTFSTTANIDGWNIEETGASSPWADDTGWDVANVSAPLASGWNIGLSDLVVNFFFRYTRDELNGDIEYPIIRITGPITNPSLIHLETNEKIRLTNGLVVPGGDYVEIDLRYGFKTIKDSAGNDVSEFLSTNSDLSTWHISYPTELLSNGLRTPITGLNRFLLTGTNISPATSISFNYFHRYVGI